MPAEKKPDLFVFLDKLNKADVKYLDTLSEKDKKSFAPLVIMRWLSGTNDKKQIQYLNHLINPKVFSLYHHPDLAFKLCMASCSGTPKKFRWIKKLGAAKKLSGAMDIVVRYYNCSVREARDYLQILSAEEILEIATELGEEKDAIKKLKKELDV